MGAAPRKEGLMLIARPNSVKNGNLLRLFIISRLRPFLVADKKRNCSHIEFYQKMGKGPETNGISAGKRILKAFSV
jgi:hypothetical protein